VILNQLLDNIRLENEIYHKDVTDAMFRQVQSAKAKPFKANIITANTTINAVDYDLGRQRVAYYDKDTSSYQYTPGVKTQGNRGHAYRNDGVDIEKDADGYHIFNIEDGEWLQYTVNVKKKGTYTIKFNGSLDKGGVSSDTGPGIRLEVLGEKLSTVYITGSEPLFAEANLTHVVFNAGVNTMRVQAIGGGFNLKSIQFTLDK